MAAKRVELDKKQHPSPGPSFRIAGGARLPEKLHQPNPALNIRAKSGRFRRCYRRFHFRRICKPVALHCPSPKLMREHVSRAPSSPPGDAGAPVARTTTKESPFHQRPHQRPLVTCNRVGAKSAPALRAPPFLLSMPSPTESRLRGGRQQTQKQSPKTFFRKNGVRHMSNGGFQTKITQENTGKHAHAKVASQRNPPATCIYQKSISPSSWGFSGGRHICLLGISPPPAPRDFQHTSTF